MRCNFARLATIPVACVIGCSGATESTPAGSGGDNGLGGSPVAGGSNQSGGSSSVSLATGGAPTAGGGMNTGGAVATGGIAPTGGAVATGSAVTTGGVLSTGGVAQTGGAVATGGSKTLGGASSTGGTKATGGSLSAGGAKSTGGASSVGGTANTGGVTGVGGSTGACSGNCSNAVAGACSAPQVRVTSVALGSTLNYSTDETANIPLAIAAKPGGGSRIAWMTGYAKYGSSTTGQVHIAELDCDDKLVGTPVTMPAHDFQDLAADANGGVITLTRDAEGTTADHCGDVNNLCGLPSDRPGCYNMYTVRYDCSGAEQWATKLTTATAANPPYTASSGNNSIIWWYQHQGRLAYDGTYYATYFASALTVQNGSCVDIHQGDRMQVVHGTTGALATGHDSFAWGCSHSWTTRIVWDPRTSRFVMVCATDNNCRIAKPAYTTVATGACDGTLFGGDIVLASTTGYWMAWSQGGNIRLEHFTTGASDQTISNAGASQNPHLVSYGTNRMLLTWASGSSMSAQVRDAGTGATVGAQFTIAAPGHPWQAWKPYPDGSVAFASVGSASATIQISRVMPCSG